MAKSKVWVVWRSLATLGGMSGYHRPANGKEGQTRTGASLPQPPLSDSSGGWWPTWQPGGTNSTDEQRRGINGAKQTPKICKLFESLAPPQNWLGKTEACHPSRLGNSESICLSAHPGRSACIKHDLCLYSIPPNKSQG